MICPDCKKHWAPLDPDSSYREKIRDFNSEMALYCPKHDHDDEDLVAIYDLKGLQEALIFPFREGVCSCCQQEHPVIFVGLDLSDLSFSDQEDIDGMKDVIRYYVMEIHYPFDEQTQCQGTGSEPETLVEQNS